MGEVGAEMGKERAPPLIALMPYLAADIHMYLVEQRRDASRCNKRPGCQKDGSQWYSMREVWYDDALCEACCEDSVSARHAA